MAEKEVFLTIDGLRKIEKELDFLKGEKRLMIAERIKQAREFGDITENSEYDDAKNEHCSSIASAFCRRSSGGRG